MREVVFQKMCAVTCVTRGLTPKAVKPTAGLQKRSAKPPCQDQPVRSKATLGFKQDWLVKIRVRSREQFDTHTTGQSSNSFAPPYCSVHRRMG